jgi:ribonuclease Z
MIFQTYILGCSAATPTSVRHTTAQLLQYHNKYFLLDCAEGTQKQIRRMKLPMMKIDHIFISHLHGDHYLGLSGLLFSWHLLGRTKKLHIYSPEGLQDIIELQFKVSNTKPSYEIIFHVLTRGEELIYEDKNITVETIEMDHRITTFGFYIREKQKTFNLRKESIVKFSIPVEKMKSIKDGHDLILDDGTTIPNIELTLPPSPLRSYAFCSDTGYSENYINQIKGADLLYHEATFLNDKAEIAEEKTHCTTLEAATIAKKAQVKKLILGHYSARYDDMEMFEKEARTIFENTILGEEGLCVPVGQE